MITLLFILFIFGLLSCWSIGLISIFVVIYQLASSLGVNISLLQIIFSIVVMLSIPASLLLIGFLLDDFIFPFDKKSYFSGLAWAISCYLLVSSDSFIMLIENFYNPISFGSLFNFFILTINRILLSSTIVSLGLVFLVLFIELPFLYISKITRSNFSLPLRSIRSIFVCFIISLSFQVIYDFISSEVSLDSILSSSEFIDKAGES